MKGPSRRRGGQHHGDAVGLSDADAALWHTLKINLALDAGAPVQPVARYDTIYPMVAGEHVLARGSFQLLEFRSLGDGSYMHNNSMFFATGAAGGAATIAFGVGRAIGNANRKAAAAAAATPRWTPIDGGVLDITTYRIMFAGSSLFPWHYSAFTSAQLVGPSRLLFTGNTDDGRNISWVLACDWAELAFTLWARAHAPHHPQLHNWLHPGWRERVTAAGHPLPAAPTADIPSFDKANYGNS